MRTEVPDSAGLAPRRPQVVDVVSMNPASSEHRTLPPLTTPDLDHLRTRLERGLMRLAELSRNDREEPSDSPPEHSPADRRQLPRRDGNCRVAVCLLEDGLTPQDLEWRLHATSDRGILEDISLKGAAFRLPRKLASGTELFLQLCSPRQDGPLNCRARVIRASKHSTGDWKMSCEFAERIGLEDLGRFSRFLDRRTWV